MNGSRGPILGALAVAACCGAASLIASGALAAFAGAAVRIWPLLVLGAGLVGYGALKLRRKNLRRPTTQPRRGP